MGPVGPRASLSPFGPGPPAGPVATVWPFWAGGARRSGLPISFVAALLGADDEDLLLAFLALRIRADEPDDPLSGPFLILDSPIAETSRPPER